ncbi:MAG: septum site-determining protein MinC, partial [Aeromonas veronii]
MVERDNELKGTTFTISVLHISDGEPERIRQLLAEKVAQAPYFFNCAPLVINVSRLEHIPDFEQLKELVESEEFVLVGITGARSEEMKTAAKAVGLAVMASGKSRKSEPEPEPAPAPAAPEVVREPEPAPLIPSKVHVGP